MADMSKYVFIPTDWMDEIDRKLADIQARVTTATPEPAKMLTPDEVAERLSTTRVTVYRWIREGELESIKIGRRVYVPASALERRQ